MAVCEIFPLSFGRDLSFNPFVCDCKLVRLVSWLQDQGIRVKRPNSMLCDRPPEVKNQPLLNVSVHTCGLTYAGCLQDEEHAAGVELVIFSSSTPGPFSREECNSKCFHDSQRYGGLGQQRECLCSTNSEPNHISESQCSAACSDPLGLIFALRPQVNFSASLPSRRVSVHSEAVLSVASSVFPASFSWDFGDLSPRVNTSTANTTARHKYGVPGRYQAQVSLSAGHQEIVAQGNVSVELPPRLELHCPELIVANQSLEEAVSLVNWGGVGITVDWRITKDGREIARGTRQNICCGDLCAPITVCQALDEWINGTSVPSAATPCPAGSQYCPYAERCLPLASPCHPGACVNCSGVSPLPAGTQYPEYRLVREVLITLPSGPPSNVLVQGDIETLLVSPGDFFAIQHDAGPSGLLQCSSDLSSPWKQSVLIQNRSDWWDANETLQADAEGVWEEGVVCQVRVLYVGQNSTTLQGPFLRSGLPQLGDHSLEVTSSDEDFPVTASCLIHVVPPLGPTVIYPTNHNGTVYFLPNQTWILVTVRSQHDAQIGWQGSNETVPVHDACPENLMAKVAECRQPDPYNDTMFAWFDLQLGSTPGQTNVLLHVKNSVTKASLQIQARVQEPLQGLVIKPHPAHRVLMESVVSYTASVEGGTDPSFKWTVDDKPYFTYYNSMLNIIYQNAAVYKLTVTAMNQVSVLTEHFNVTVDRMNPMTELTVHGVPKIVQQGLPLNLYASVKIDMALDVTFWWGFGDGGNCTHQFKPPYDNPSSNQVVIRDVVSYIYAQPGEYTLLFSASNGYENKTCKVDVYVFSILTSVRIEINPPLLRAEKPADFEAHPLPSPYGIIYTWNFGDNSSVQQGRERRVPHAYTHSGVYNICVNVNNTISSTDTCMEVIVYEDIKGLDVVSSDPTERNTPTVVTASLEAGNNVTWSFDMGDGTVHMGVEPQVEYTYRKDGHYTVNVTAKNAVSSQWVTIPVEVFVLQVLSLEPSGCIQENKEVLFHAFVSGNASGHQYVWSFGDGSSNESQYGTPLKTHSYVKSGEYHLSLLMSSEANKANFYTRICVQPELTTVSLFSPKTHIKFGEEIRFTVDAFPEFNYTYLWDFGVLDSRGPVRGGKEMAFTFKSPGEYLVTVTALNNISCINDSVSVVVQQSVGFLLISHNGDKENNLSLHQDYVFKASSHSVNAVYIWDFGDGIQLNGTNVSHAYNSSGRFNITVTGKNEVSETKNEISVVVLAPITGLSVNASLVNVPLNTSVHFEAHLDQGDDVRYSWILCDRCTSIQGTHTMFYTFRSVGTFNVIVTAENDIGMVQSSISIFVQRELEGLQIVADELIEGCCFSTNRVLHLQASLKEGTNMTFRWNLQREHKDHDYNLTGKSIDLNFSTPGPCDVLLKATNLLGQLAVNKTIEFLDPVRELVIEISPNPAAVNAMTNMAVSATFGTALHYRWWADDELLTSDMSSVMHSFRSAGLKLVKVEVSNKVSSEMVSKWISIQEPISGLTFIATNVTENFVASGDNVSLRGETQMGSSISWMWLLPDNTKSNQRTTSYIFPKPGIFTVALNATNDINRETCSRDFTVQDRIQGLELKASKQIAAVGENVEFTISVSSGTSVNFILSISGDATVVLNNQTYIHQFTSVAKYYVNLTAHNQVSSERRTLHIEVMEPVTKLTIKDCCDAAIPVGVSRAYVASTPTREPLTILWTFDLHHGLKISQVGKTVTYAPDQPGNLTIFLRAFNSLNGLNVTKVIRVQNSIKSATLDAQPSDTFVNKTVSFHVGITPISTPATYQWDFGDGTSAAVTTAPSLSHIYILPGHYVVRVNVSNLVSLVTAQVDVNISVLKCDEPEVQIIQAPRLAIWRYQPTLVEANVDLKGCGLYGVEYLWEILTTPRCQDDEKKGLPPSKVRLPPEVNVRRLQLSVPKMSISAGNYTLVFSLSYEGVPLRKAACIQLSVMSKKLVPIIEGGTYRVWSKTQDLHLSAEQSYDPNLDPENQPLLNYHWECVSTSKGPAHCSTLHFGLGPSDPVLGISGSELELDVEYTFRLTISKEGMTPESTNQTVWVQNGRIPMVSLECVSCKAQSRYEISQSSYVYLAGTCNNCHSSHRGRWTAMTGGNETLVLDLNTTTTGSDSMNLVLRQGILRDGDSYIFSLHVTDDSMDREGVAYIELHPNLPPAGGTCSLWADGDGPQVRTLLERVHFSCSGETTEEESPLVYSLLAVRCSRLYCEEFCVYKGTSSEHSAFLPPGFSSARYQVTAIVMVEDHQGATVMARNKSMEVVLPAVPDGFSCLPHWLSNLTDSTLRELLRQGDSQRVRELSLALITVLNEVRPTVHLSRVSKAERQYRVSVRGNITRALTSLDLTTVSDIQQTSAALAQCTAVSREFVCEECQNSTLDRLESMLEILQTDTKQSTVTPTEIADNILNIMGNTHTHTLLRQQSSISWLCCHHPLRVAAKAYTLSSVLMRILMLGRVLNEEPLILRAAEIAAAGKRADPQSLLCYGESDAPECQRFSIPRAFNNSLGRASGGALAPNSEDGIVQLLFQVEPNPFPFNYVTNYTVSTEVASMEFRTVNGTQIPISDLDDSHAITVAVNNGSVAGLNGNRLEAVLPPAGAENISRCGSIIVRVSTRNTNRQAGIYVQLNFTVLDEKWKLDPFITAYLHTSEWPNEYNSTDRKRITLNMTRGLDLDHRLYTFFLSPKGCGADDPDLIRLEVAVFTSLCQYFSESANQWRTDGMDPLPETSVSRAVCRTHHLTAFAASLFVPVDAVSFIIPERSVTRSLVVVLVCVMGLLCYAVAGAIMRKLDQMDLRRASVVPLCGKDALYKYEIQVKTGWAYGAGTTAHVGISLHGSESRSGHRHLDSIGAFARNSLDIFHIASDTSLGSVLKIRVWHDNKGLSPAWLLQYVLVKDLQTGSSYFFLVEEWLSVDNEKTDGRVEIEVEASGKAPPPLIEQLCCDWLVLELDCGKRIRLNLCCSLQGWSIPDCDWPDVLTDPSVEMGPVFPPRLKRGQGSRHLGVDIPFSPDEEDTVCDIRNKYFSSSGDTLPSFLSCTCVYFLHTWYVFSACVRRIEMVVYWMLVLIPRPFPPLCGLAALWASWVGLILSSSLSMWLGRSFSEGVALMWLISCIVSFLSSFLLLEPLKVLLESVYFSLLVGRLRAEEQDVLVDCPRVERVVQRIPRVRPPQGFALSQAREEARKVRLLHTMLKGFLLYMLFLLVVLLLNYSDSAKDAHRRRLHTQLQEHFITEHFNNISRYQTHTHTHTQMYVWHWGQVSVYSSTGFVQDLSRTMQDSRALLKQLSTHQWLDPLTRALFVEFPLYNINTDLLAVFTFLLEFPVSEHAQLSLDLKTCSLHTLSHGMDLPLFLTLLLLVFVIYFAVREGVVAYKQGCGYFLRLWNVASVCSLLLAICVAMLHLSRSVLSAHQWGLFLQQRDTFMDFFPLAQQNQVLTQLSASLLFLLILKASHQLRFMREWGVFGRTLRRSFWELLTVAVTLLVFLLLLGSSGRGLLSWRPDSGSSLCSASCFIFHISFTLLRLVLLWLLISALLRNYHRARAELYRPAVDLQDYEMVELFLRRLKMWMGLSRAKEFRHKVRFEGMELPPSRSSSTSDCKSLCLPPLDTPEAPPTPDSVDGGSEASWRPTSSSPCSLAEAPGLGLAEMEATLRRILPAFDALLLQLDRVTHTTEELYRTECHLEMLVRKSRRGRGVRCHRSLESAGQKRHRYKGTDRSIQVAESSKYPLRTEISASASERNLNKRDRRSRKSNTFPQIKSDLPTSINKVDLSPHRTDSLQKGQETPGTVVTDVGMTEKDPHKVDSGPCKANTPEGNCSPPRGQKADKASHKVKGNFNKVDPNLQRDSEVAGCASKPVPTPVLTPASASSAAPVSGISNPVPIPRSHGWIPPSNSENLPSSVFRHPAHTTTNPTRKRKHKPPPLKNKVHPNTDRPISGHPKP
uniref:Polycystic kidney disease 1a n=1 Tax=Cyprinus carpio TaxID=7962 RepID=A0A8C2IMT9_CYPCA